MADLASYCILQLHQRHLAYVPIPYVVQEQKLDCANRRIQNSQHLTIIVMVSWWIKLDQVVTVMIVILILVLRTIERWIYNIFMVLNHLKPLINNFLLDHPWDNAL